jgi:hypothetical protein
LRFIAFWECDDENLEKYIEIWNERIKKDRTVKTILHPHTMADAPKGVKGFTIFETDKIEDIMEYVTAYGTIAKVNVVPIWEASEGAKLYQKMKK